jgi:hypothetical protein
MKKIVLGNKVKDKVTGFTGIAICKCLYLNGCIQFHVSPKVDRKGDLRCDEWFDEQQLVYVAKGLVVEPKPTGGGKRKHP